jgi:hypothetical protein
MEEQEFEGVRECAECGQEVVEDTPFFEFAGDRSLCLDCAVRRGAQYDFDRERWAVAPDLSGLVQVTEEQPTL